MSANRRFYLSLVLNLILGGTLILSVRNNDLTLRRLQAERAGVWQLGALTARETLEARQMIFYSFGEEGHSLVAEKNGWSVRVVPIPKELQSSPFVHRAINIVYDMYSYEVARQIISGDRETAEFLITHLEKQDWMNSHLIENYKRFMAGDTSLYDQVAHHASGATGAWPFISSAESGSARAASSPFTDTKSSTRSPK